ncbi:MAG: glycosyltransferase [Paludibacteraceae bacterium]
MKKALFVTFNNIFEENTGGNQGSLRNFKLLSKTYETDVYVIKSSKLCKLLSSFFSFYFPPLSYNNIKDINKMMRLKKYDLFFLDSSLLGKLLKHIIKQSNTKTISFFHNVEYDFIKARFGKNAIKYPYLALAYFNEKTALRYSTITISLSTRDKKRLKEIYNYEPTYIMPVAFEDKLNDYNSKGETAITLSLQELKPYCLFVGSLSRSNFDGIKWFIDNISPLLPKLNTVVVGKGFENHKKELSRDNVIVVGLVDEIAPYYLDADFVVSPLFSGAGMKIKVVEALMYGKAIIGTKESFEGFGTDSYPGATIECNSKEEFSSKIEKLYLNNDFDVFNRPSREMYLEKIFDGCLCKFISKYLKLIINH